jgi:hypothetical protein
MLPGIKCLLCGQFSLESMAYRKKQKKEKKQGEKPGEILIEVLK